MKTAFVIVRGAQPNWCCIGTFRADVAERWRSEGYAVQEVDAGPDGEAWTEETLTDVAEADALAGKGCAIPDLPEEWTP